MKRYSWFLLFLYFGLFIAFGIFFYYKYLDRFLKAGAEPQTIETLKSAEYIYYSAGNNLYRLDPDLQIDPTSPARVERFQSTGEVNFLDINKSGNLLAYEVKNSEEQKEIWQVDIQTNESAKIAYAGVNGLSDFQEFSRPKFSPESNLLAMIGSGINDQLLVYNLENSTFRVLTNKFAVKIVDFAWKDNQKIIYCTSNLTLNVCDELNLADESDHQILQASVSQIAASAASLIYLTKDQEANNLFLLNLENSTTISLSDLGPPKKVTRFGPNKANDRIVYEVTADNLSDIYSINSNGSNRTQLTTDGQSRTPLINSQGDKVALQKPDGIYSQSIENNNLQKIINLSEPVNLLLWR